MNKLSNIPREQQDFSGAYSFKGEAEEWKNLKAPESWITRSTTPRERIDPSTICDICFESEENCDD